MEQAQRQGQPMRRKPWHFALLIVAAVAPIGIVWALEGFPL